jgi:hypothetical protein
MFIKRFYLQLINNYFIKANFVKPTGDGLLMTFPYSESNLLEISETVLNSCLNCLNDFPTLCNDDPMINFTVPQAIGFGIARGTACCLYSGREIIDYSGHLLNLASRLNDLARPSGIVIDGSYMLSVIPESARESFEEQLVYVRSIAESKPMKVFYLDGYVQISDHSLSPLVGKNWRTVTEVFTAKDYKIIDSKWIVDLPSPAKSKDNVIINILIPKKGVREMVSMIDFNKFSYVEEGAVPYIELDMEQAHKEVPPQSLKRDDKITFKIEYIPKPLPRT